MRAHPAPDSRVSLSPLARGVCHIQPTAARRTSHRRGQPRAAHAARPATSRIADIRRRHSGPAVRKHARASGRHARHLGSLLSLHSSLLSSPLLSLDSLRVATRSSCPRLLRHSSTRLLMRSTPRLACPHGTENRPTLCAPALSLSLSLCACVCTQTSRSLRPSPRTLEGARRPVAIVVRE